VVAMRVTESRKGGAVNRTRHITRGGQTEAFVKARDTETLREGTANRDLRDRHELHTNLRREVRLTRRIIVVTTRSFDFELIDDRRHQFEEGRLHVAATGRTNRVDAIIAIILVAEGAG